jgi:hypothetical protein
MKLSILIAYTKNRTKFVLSGCASAFKLRKQEAKPSCLLLQKKPNQKIELNRQNQSGLRIGHCHKAYHHVLSEEEKKSEDATFLALWL